MLSRRFFLGGLLAAPAVVAIGNLMPLVGVKYDPLVVVQSWPIGAQKYGAWWSNTCRLSEVAKTEAAMTEMFGAAYWEHIADDPVAWRGPDYMGTEVYADGVRGSWMGVKPTAEEMAEHHRMSSKDPKWNPTRRASYNGCVINLDGNVEEQRSDIDRAWGYFTKNTEALIERKRQLHTLGHPDANRILREAGYVI